MRWGKIVLLFQAIITLIIGIVFFIQFLSIDHANIEKLNVEMPGGDIIWEKDALPTIVDLKQKYSVATYVLLIISIFEILLISRIVD